MEKCRLLQKISDLTHKTWKKSYLGNTSVLKTTLRKEGISSHDNWQRSSSILRPLSLAECWFFSTILCNIRSIITHRRPSDGLPEGHRTPQCSVSEVYWQKAGGVTWLFFEAWLEGLIRNNCFSHKSWERRGNQYDTLPLGNVDSDKHVYALGSFTSKCNNNKKATLEVGNFDRSLM